MKNAGFKKPYTGKLTEDVKIAAASIVLLYLLISLYFMNHFFFNTVINGVDVSLKAYEKAEEIILSYVKNYRLQLIERDGETEEIMGQDIGLRYNRNNSSSKIHRMQVSVKWPISLFKEQSYYVGDLFVYDKGRLEGRINELNCLNKDITEPRNVSFKYVDGYYETVKEVYGNKLHRGRLHEVIKRCVLKGQTMLDLDRNHCYINPKYTLSSDKTALTRNRLDKYVSTRITYILRSQKELLDKSIINKWLGVDGDLEVIIDKEAIMQYLYEMSKKYDTVSTARKFKTSRNKIVEVKGGFYGWKIDREAEAKALIENIRRGDVLEKEPIYAQRAFSDGDNDIGNTYVEINLTRQHLWFYKEGRLIAQGAVVTGNPNRGNATEAGIYMINYKQMGPTLTGPGYEAEVTYWMPFNGDIGIHDASWRYSFGGNVYKRNGSHGCVNVPVYLAKKIFNNIEEGTPVICYEE